MSGGRFVSKNIDFGGKMSDKLQSENELKKENKSSSILPDLISNTISVTKQMMTEEEKNRQLSSSQIKEQNNDDDRSNFTVFR